MFEVVYFMSYVFLLPVIIILYLHKVQVQSHCGTIVIISMFNNFFKIALLFMLYYTPRGVRTLHADN